MNTYEALCHEFKAKTQQRVQLSKERYIHETSFFTHIQPRTPRSCKKGLSFLRAKFYVLKSS